MPNSKRALDNADNDRPATSKRQKHAAKNVRLDELAWKKVPMPDRLEDVEGFYGLEEVDDVEVLGAHTGKMEFKVVERPKKKKKGAAEPAEPEVEDISADAEEDEWKGFSDSEAEAPPRSSTDIDAKKERNKKKQKEKKEKKPKEKGSQTVQQNPFDALQQDVEDDIDVEVNLPEWEELDLAPPVLRAIAKLGFSAPTPIQKLTIPDILAGQDLIGKASTGSGKTLAFGIPILESFLKSHTPGDEDQRLPHALILSPTRELAHQINDHLTALAVFIPELNIVSVTGGMSVQKQRRQLEQKGGADIIVATPGRLWEVVSEGTGWVDKLRSGLKFLVVDEADRLLQEGHFKEVENLLQLLQRGQDEELDDDVLVEFDPESLEFEDKAIKPRKKTSKKPPPAARRQTLVFSATFHQGLQQKLASKNKKNWTKESGGGLLDQKESMEYLLKKLNFRTENPKFVDANPINQMASLLREGIVECGAMEKDLYLYYLLLRYPCKALVFTNSISSVKRLTPYLNELQLPANPLHSNMIQKARLRSLERFSSPQNKTSILIATDVAARGLDIKGVEMIIHYHLPRTADMYIHRSGRTARSTERGISILLCAPEEVMGVRRLVGKVHQGDTQSNSRYAMKSFDVDRSLVARLKRRANLAKKIADSTSEKAKKSKEDDWLKNAADELGVDYDSEEFASLSAGKKGQRGKQKRQKAVDVPQEEVQAWRSELKALLKEKVNSGFSERYLTSGIVNIARALLEGEMTHENILGVQKKRVVDEVAW